MFTGIILDLGKIISIQRHNRDMSLKIKFSNLKVSEIRFGDSIAVNGVCLTVTDIDVDVESNCVSFDVSNETLSKTSLSKLTVGRSVNIEPALKLSDRLGGHLVSGHVDVVVKILRIYRDARSYRFHFELPQALSHLIAAKGSITIDGVSLTVNQVTRESFEINIVPHTWVNTLFQYYRVQDCVNLEVDMVARYLERIVQK